MKVERTHVVVGSSLSALLFSYINDCPVIFTSPTPPSRFEYLSTKLDLSFLKMPFTKTTLATFDDKVQVGTQKILLWERLLFLQSLSGNVLSTIDTKSLRLSGERIVLSNEYSKIADLFFEKCYYFGDPNTSGFIEKTNLDEAHYLCYDYIAFNSGGKHEIDFIHSDDDFVSTIWFYSSDRIDGNTPVKDACAVSRLSKNQLQEFDFSETMARFKTVQIMKDKGMRGKLNGYTKKGTPRHYDFRTSSIKRHVCREYDEPRSLAACVEVKAPDEKGLLQSLPHAASKSRILLERLDANTS